MDKTYEDMRIYISVLYRQFQIYINNNTKDLQISASEYIFLMEMYKNDNMSQEQLSKNLIIDKSATARAIKSLEEKEYIIRKKDDERKGNHMYNVLICDDQPDIVNALKIYLTPEGYKKLKEELDHMRSVERPAISAAIAEARDKGDLSENAEYDAAREAQGLLEMRIAKLEQTLTNARVIDESKIDKSKVQILSKVTLLNHNNNKQVTYTIVSENEANLREGKLAIGTPIAKALLGKKKGDTVEVNVPAGVIKFEILDINI